jgi:hypothetical protein
MSFRNSAKVWHFFISVALVFITFLFLTFCVYRRRGSHSWNFFHRLGQASLFSLVIGFLKEGLDAVSNDWFWCVRETCDFNGWDVAIYVDGVVLGALIIVCVKMCTLPPAEESPPCDRTVASTIDGDDDDEENANAIRNNASTKHGFSNDEIPAEIVLNDESSNAGASASAKKSTSTEDVTTTSDSSTGVESDSYALDDDEEQQMPPV